MARTTVRARGDALERTGFDHCLAEVESKLVIGEFSCLITAPDQVVARLGSGIEFVHKCPQSAAGPVANNRIADLSTDRVGHFVAGEFRGDFYETNS